MPERLIFQKLNCGVSGFSCGNPSIEGQLRDAYFQSCLEISSTFSICQERTKRVLGYFCLAMRRIEPDAFPEEIREVDIGRKFWYYAVEIKYLAIDLKLQKRKIGTNALHMIIQTLDKCHNQIPYRFIYIDALEDKEQWYHNMGFQRFEDQTAVGGTYSQGRQSTVPMFYDLHRQENDLNEYFSSVG